MSKSNQKNFRNSTKLYTPPHGKLCPAISVVIPLYNVEKYIGECLDSLLAQTFQNFEVIVVDNCSTDLSPAIAKNYVSKFEGRFKLVKTKKNSGTPGLPRNLGFSLSRGEYIYFMDGDDTITPTALEELYTLVKKYDADVVHCEKYYHMPDELWNNTDFRAQLKPCNYLTGEKVLVTQPLIWDNNFAERMEWLLQHKLIWNTWAQLIRRDFIINNELIFCNIYAEDMVFTVCELCCAERYVVVPNVIYYYRQREGSTMHERLDVQNLIHKNIDSVTCGIRYLDEFLSSRDFFVSRPDLKYGLFDFITRGKFNSLNEIYAQIPAHALDELLRKEFSSGDNVALTSFVFSAMNVYRLQLMQSQQHIAELEAALKNRQ